MLAGDAGGGYSSLFNVEYAVEVLSDLGAPFDPSTPLAAIEAARQGGRYADSPGQQPSWGTTAVAVATLRRLGVPVPAEVVAEVNGAVQDAANHTWDYQEVISNLAPLLEAGADLGAPSDQLEDLAATAQGILDANSDPVVTPAVAAGLREAFRRNSLTPPETAPGLCDHGAIPGFNQVQIEYEAATLGCPGAAFATPAAESISGWVEPWVKSDTLRLSSSLAGYLLTRQASAHTIATRAALRAWVNSEYGHHLRSQYEEYPRAKLTAALGMDTVAKFQKPHGGLRVNPRTTIWALQITDLLRTKRVRVDADTAWMKKYLRTVATQTRERLGQASIFDAAALESAARTYHQASWHRLALRVARSLRLPNGMYKLARHQSGYTAMSTALGAWVRHRAVGRARFVAAGLCDASGCQQAPSTGTVVVSLGATEAVTLAGTRSTVLPFFLT